MTVQSILSFTNDYQDFLHDESRKEGRADSISFPKNTQQVQDIVSEMYMNDMAITVQGARTGIAAGAVPEGGHILNLSRMDRILGLEKASMPDSPVKFLLHVQPGVTLQEIRESLENKDFDTEKWDDESKEALEELKQADAWLFPPDLTETTASIGGMVSTNASGARSFYYGPTRPHVYALSLVLADGSLVELERGKQKANGLTFRLELSNGRNIEGSLPNYQMPDVKSAAGYWVKPDMDLIDLIIGSEGTLGIVTEMKIGIQPAAPVRWGFTAFLPSEEEALKYVRAVRGEDVEGVDTEMVAKPSAIEFFNDLALEMLRKQKADNPAFAYLPEMPPEYNTAVYVEYEGQDEDEVAEAIMAAAEMAEACGGDEDATWSATEPSEIERLRQFRHATPEAVNLTIDERRKTEPKLTKLGTDMAVPDDKLEEVMALYRKTLEESGLESVIFGHIGNNHVHVNIIPKNMEEYDKGKALYLDWAKKVVEMGGTVSAEHGIGKIKAAFLSQMYGKEGITQMKAVKNFFDPKGLLNRGTLFD